MSAITIIVLRFSTFLRLNIYIWVWKSALKDWNDYGVKQAQANSYLVCRNTNIVHIQPTRDQMLDIPSHARERMKIESYCVHMSKGSCTKEGKIERISLSGKFRRARMA